MRAMAAQGRRTFTIHSQNFVVQDNFEITKELGQGAYGIVVSVPTDTLLVLIETNTSQVCQEYTWIQIRVRCDKEGYKYLLKEDPRQALSAGGEASPAL